MSRSTWFVVAFGTTGPYAPVCRQALLATADSDHTLLKSEEQDNDYPTEARSLGRTLIRWKHQARA
jgi:hypothetical protein